MLSIPSALRAQFDERLLEKTIPRKTQQSYIKWLRYYLDFCRKYDFHKSNRESLPLFLKKLEEKKQTRAQLQQAADAIALYYGIIGEKYHTAECPSLPNTITKGHNTFKNAEQYADKEAFLLTPASNRSPFQSTTPIPEGSREKKADSGKALRIAERDPKY